MSSNQTRRDFNKTMCFSAAASAASGSKYQTVAKSGSKRPNFIFFLVDDLSWIDADKDGCTSFETSNFDKLASEGMLVSATYEHQFPFDEETLDEAFKNAGYVSGYIGKRSSGSQQQISVNQRLENENLTNQINKEVQTFLEHYKENSFLLFVSHYCDHNPNRTNMKLTKKSASMVSSTNEILGHVMTKLKELELAKNTVIIFMSDITGLDT